MLAIGEHACQSARNSRCAVNRARAGRLRLASSIRRAARQRSQAAGAAEPGARSETRSTIPDRLANRLPRNPQLAHDLAVFHSASMHVWRISSGNLTAWRSRRQTCIGACSRSSRQTKAAIDVIHFARFSCAVAAGGRCTPSSSARFIHLNRAATSAPCSQRSAKVASHSSILIFCSPRRCSRGLSSSRTACSASRRSLLWIRNVIPTTLPPPRPPPCRVSKISTLNSEIRSISSTAGLSAQRRKSFQSFKWSRQPSSSRNCEVWTAQ